MCAKQSPALSTASNIQVTQAWFESGGVVEQALIMIVSNFIFVEGLKVFQIYPLVMRYLVSPFVVSQKRKDALWAPPRMLLGDLYAGAVKTVALCLICKSPPHRTWVEAKLQTG